MRNFSIQTHEPSVYGAVYKRRRQLGGKGEEGIKNPEKLPLSFFDGPYQEADFQCFFFRCVQNDQCDRLINIRGLDDLVTTNLVCDDPNHTCCHESVLKNLNQCQKYYEMGYRYVHKQ